MTGPLLAGSPHHTDMCGRALFLRALLCLLTAGALPASAADAMRCGSRLVAVEARAAEVLAVCGEPTYRDIWTFQHPNSQSWVSDVEEWYYNFGSNQLLRVLRIRNGRLVNIDSDGYGFNADARPGCNPAMLVEGLSKYRLLRSCGEPLTRSAHNAYRPLRGRSQRSAGSGLHHEYLMPVYREEWVYNFGSRYLMRVLTLENGRVVDVDNGARGSDPR